MERWPLIRDVALFSAGLMGAAYSLVVNPEIGEQWLILFAAMMGLPAFLQKDEAK